MRLRPALVAALAALAVACSGGDAVPTDPADGVPTAGEPEPGVPGQRDPGGQLEEPEPTDAGPLQQEGIRTPEE